MNGALMKRLVAAGLLCAAVLSTAAARAETVDRIVAVINDQIVTESELEAATSLALEKLPGGAGRDPAKRDEIRERILDGIVEQKLVKQAADKAGIEISEKEIDNAVEDVKKQNNFTHDAFLLALANSGLTYRGYREQLKEQIRQYKFMNREFRSRTQVGPEEIEDYYRRNIDEFTVPASFRLRAIYLSGSSVKKIDTRLKAVEDGLKAGESFEELARQYSDGAEASSGGDLGFIKPGEIDADLEAAAAKLKPGETSPVITRPGGIYILQLVERGKAEPRPLNAVRGVIHEKLFTRRMDERFRYWLEDARKTAHVEIRLNKRP